MTIAFFDLDKTLLSFNSARRWIRRELAARRMSHGQVVDALYWSARYRFGLTSIEPGILKAIATLKGQSEPELRARTENFFHEEIRAHFRPGAHKVLDQHRGANHSLVLLTSSSTYLSHCVAQQLKLDAFLCTEFEVLDGVFTGRPVEPLCYGIGKVTHALRFAREHSVALSDCYYYGDSFADAPMLDAVGHPVVVHPDPRLRRLAISRGWPMQDWGTRTSSSTTSPVGSAPS